VFRGIDQFVESHGVLRAEIRDRRTARRPARITRFPSERRNAATR
jgi:hypothetical protein